MSIKNSKPAKYRIPYATRFEIALCIALACVNIALLALICELVNVSAVFPAIIIALLYLVEVALIGANHKANLKVYPRQNIHHLLNEEGSIIIKNSLYPVIAMDIHGVIL